MKLGRLSWKNWRRLEPSADPPVSFTVSFRRPAASFLSGLLLPDGWLAAGEKARQSEGQPGAGEGKKMLTRNWRKEAATKTGRAERRLS